MVSNDDFKIFFGSVHMKESKALYNQFNQLYEDVTGEECRYRDFQLMFTKWQLKKTLIVSAATLKEEQDGVNFLALATGVWLTDAELLFDGNSPAEFWKEIIFGYVATLYKAMGPNHSAKEIHQSMAAHTKALKQVSMRKWIGFLDNNKLKRVSAQNYKCLYMSR